MTRWLADASTLLSSVDALDPEHAAAKALLAEPWSVATLDLAYYEVVNVALRGWESPRHATIARDVVTAIAEGDDLVRGDEILIAQAGGSPSATASPSTTQRTSPRQCGSAPGW